MQTVFSTYPVKVIVDGELVGISVDELPTLWQTLTRLLELQQPQGNIFQPCARQNTYLILITSLTYT